METQVSPENKKAIQKARPSFLQSPEWEEIQKRFGRKTWREEGNLVIENDLPGKFSYLYSPRPVFSRRESFESFLDKGEGIARKNGSIFLKIDPQDSWISPEKNFFPAHSLQPQKTVTLDLAKPGENLLGSMHEKTRYAIRLATRNGVEIGGMEKGQFSLENFFELLKITSDRQNFGIHPFGYYQKLVEVQTSEFSNEIFYAKIKGEVIAAVMVNFYVPSRTATYIHGASSRTQKLAMGPAFLQWNVIKEAKKRMFDIYDFGGIDEIRWPGVTKFKIKFGGEILEYPPAADVVYRPWLYRGYKISRLLREKI